MYKKSLIAISALAMLSSSSLADTTNLSDVLVTAKSNKSIDELSSTVTVVTADDIAKMNASNISDILVKTPGIIQSSSTLQFGGRKNISIRGLDHNYSLILIDGKRIIPTVDYMGHSDFENSWISPDMIERIEVVKGPKSSIYGSQAIGGVINIITKKEAKKLYGSLEVRAGRSAAKKGGDEQNFSANIGGNISDKLSILVGANKYKIEEVRGIFRPATKKGDKYIPAMPESTFEGIDRKEGLTKLKYNFDDTQSISASYMKGKDQRTNIIAPYILSRNVYSLGYEKSFEDISLNLDYSKAKINTNNPGNNIDLISDVLKAETKISSLKNNYIVIGAEISKMKYDNFTKPWKVDSTAKNYYIQDEIEFGDFIFSLGARLDNNEKFGNKFSPNIGALYKLDDKQRIKLNYGEGFKAPTLLQSDSSYSFPHAGNTAYGNDNLKAETSKSYELAYEYYGKDLVVKTAIFKNDLKNKITRETYKEQKIERYVNIDAVETKGFEVGIDYNLNENHNISTNYTFVEAKDKKTNKTLMGKPKHNLNVGLSSKFDYGISSYLSATYLGEQYYYDIMTGKRAKTGGFTVFNAQITKELVKNFDIKIGVDNLTNKNLNKVPYDIKQRLIYTSLKYKF